MMYQLSIDVGNTYAKVGVFQHGNLLQKRIFKSDDVQSMVDFLEGFSPRQIMYATVRTVEEKIEALAASSDAYFVLNHLTPLPISLDYKTPETLGRDRIAGVMGAFVLFPQRHVLVVDAGTCITYDVLRSEGVYAGGNIAPGVEMRQRAMHHFTAGLPLVTTNWNRDLLGKTTEEAMQNGALYGAVYEINGYINKLVTELNNFDIVFTGGDAELLAKHIQQDIIVNHDLILIGLNEILRFNVS